MPATRPANEAYMPAGPGSGPRTSAGHARVGSLQWWGRVQRTWATSAGDTSSQVWPKARPASWPLAQTSAPAPVAAPRPTARSWSPGLVNGGASGGRCPPGGRGGQASCHIRATPRHGLLEPLALGRQQRPVLARVGGDQPANRGPADLASAPLPVGVDFGQPSALATLAQPIHRPHPGVLVRVLTTTPVGEPGRSPLAVLAVAGQAAVACVEVLGPLDLRAGRAALQLQPRGVA